MKSVLSLPTLLISIAFATAWVTSTQLGQAEESGFTSLFDGTSLKGWRGDPKHWQVIDGAIVGSTKPDGRTSNTFLIAEGNYTDFVLRIKFKLTDGASGVQFRSRPIGPPTAFLVTGYQADIGGGDTGTFYEEKGRGTLVPPDKATLTAHYKKGEWNQYEIKMVGNVGEIYLNGHLTARFTESKSDVPNSGVVALQLQAGKGMEIAFKDIKIRRLKATD